PVPLPAAAHDDISSPPFPAHRYRRLCLCALVRLVADPHHRRLDPRRAPIDGAAAVFSTMSLDPATSRPSTVPSSMPSLTKRFPISPLHSWWRKPAPRTLVLALFERIGYMCDDSCVSDLKLCCLFEMESSN
uniref:Uncharacterized protein n=1 Tax=Triticum urartu TaxID=4572 RepID=A0A8R7QAB5_TRIUA